MRCRTSILALILALASALHANVAELSAPNNAILASDEPASVANDTVWAGFTRAEFVLRFLEVTAGHGTPPIMVEGESYANSLGWVALPARNRDNLINARNLARVVSGERAHWSIVYRAAAAGENQWVGDVGGNADWFEPGLRLPIEILYHPEPTQTATETATVRIYISGGHTTHIGPSFPRPHFDINFSATPPVFDSGEFALDALPASPITGGLVEQDPYNTMRALLQLSGSAATAHAGDTVYVRHRHPAALDGARHWSAFRRLATVAGDGSWAGRALLPTAADIELDLILMTSGGDQYRAHVPSVELVEAEDATNGDYASAAGDGIPNILKLATGLDPTVRASVSDFMQVETVEISGSTYGQIRYQRDPSQTTINLEPQWTPDYNASPWRAGGMVHTLVSTDGSTGIETWTARAPLADSSAYLRLSATRKSN